MNLPKLNSDAFLAPMAGVSDLAFRTLSKEFGAGLAMTEMISANDLVRREPLAVKEVKEVKLEPPPRWLQLYGLNMNNFINAAKYVNPYADLIDLNFGCPYYKLVKQGTGSALLARPGKIQQIVQNVVANTNKPVTCKIRLGLDKRNITVLEVARACEIKGASLITVHARTTDQEYSGQADWQWIKKVKEMVKIPVCGNGDVKTVEDYLRMKKETGCDYVMIGRGAIGNPFIFQQIEEYKKKGKYHLPSKEERFAALERYLELAEHYHSEFSQIKPQTLFFLERTLPDKLFKPQLEKVNNQKELNQLLERLKNA